MATQNVEFPAHERPNTEISAIAMVGIAVGFTLAWYLILYISPHSADLNTFVRDLFMGRFEVNKERVVFQSVITLVWALSMANIILKLQRVQKERATLGEDVLPDGLDMTNREKLIEVYERIKSRPNITESLSITRIARVLAMWINTADFERTAEYAREQSDLDAAASGHEHHTLFGDVRGASIFGEVRAGVHPLLHGCREFALQGDKVDSGPEPAQSIKPE